MPHAFDETGRRPARDTENEARLMGLMRMLSLPLVRAPDGTMRRRVVEIEIDDGTWQRVEGVVVESGELTFYSGSNGKRTEWIFAPDENVPRWRVDHGVARAEPYLGDA